MWLLRLRGTDYHKIVLRRHIHRLTMNCRWQLRQLPRLQAVTPYAGLQSHTHGLPRHALWSIHTAVTISAMPIIIGCSSQSITTASVSSIKDLLPIRDSHYLPCGHFRYTFNVKSDAGFVAPMIMRGFSHFWKFPCLVLTYSRNLQAGLSALTTSKHFSSPSHTAAYFSVLLGSSAVFSRLPQTVLWTLFYNVAAALVDVMRGDAGLVT